MLLMLLVCWCFCLFVCLQTASESSVALWNPWVQQFTLANCELIVSLTEFFNAVPAGVLQRLPPELVSEWQVFFVEGIHALLLPLLVKIPGGSGSISSIKSLKYDQTESPSRTFQLRSFSITCVRGSPQWNSPIRMS